jgi:hypothetical protein
VEGVVLVLEDEAAGANVGDLHGTISVFQALVAQSLPRPATPVDSPAARRT